MRLNVRAVIVRDERVVISRGERNGLSRLFLPGGAVTEGEAVADALFRTVREDIGLDVVARQLLYVAEVLGVYGMHDLNLVWLAELADPDAAIADEVLVAIGSGRGYAVLPPLIEQIAEDLACGWSNGPRWLGNVGRSWL
jgi:ADP-ribose pyrophosphatase YjhB (NUDIX family)